MKQYDKKFLHIRISTNLKKQAEQAFQNMGITTASGVRLLLSMLTDGLLPLPLIRSSIASVPKTLTGNASVPHYTEEVLAREAMVGRWKRGYYEP